MREIFRTLKAWLRKIGPERRFRKRKQEQLRRHLEAHVQDQLVNFFNRDRDGLQEMQRLNGEGRLALAEVPAARREEAERLLHSLFAEADKAGRISLSGFADEIDFIFRRAETLTDSYGDIMQEMPALVQQSIVPPEPPAPDETQQNAEKLDPDLVAQKVRAEQMKAGIGRLRKDRRRWFLFAGLLSAMEVATIYLVMDESFRGTSNYAQLLSFALTLLIFVTAVWTAHLTSQGSRLGKIGLLGVSLALGFLRVDVMHLASMDLSNLALTVLSVMVIPAVASMVAHCMKKADKCAEEEKGLSEDLKDVLHLPRVREYMQRASQQEARKLAALQQAIKQEKERYEQRRAAFYRRKRDAYQAELSAIDARIIALGERWRAMQDAVVRRAIASLRTDIELVATRLVDWSLSTVRSDDRAFGEIRRGRGGESHESAENNDHAESVALVPLDYWMHEADENRRDSR